MNKRVMHQWVAVLSLVVAAMATLGALPAVTVGAAGPAGQTLRQVPVAEPAAVPGEIVMGFERGVDASERVAARSAADVRVERSLLLPGAQLVKVEVGQTVPDAIAALERRSDVRYAEPNWMYHATSTVPNDALFGNLWGLDNSGQAVNGHAPGTADADIDAPEAWDRSQGSASVVVGVVDSGVAWDHPDLAPNIWTNPHEIPGNGIDDDNNGKVDDIRGWDFVDGDNDPWDYNDHGTHVAGTIAGRGNNGVGVTGVAWQASIMPVRVLDALGSGTAARIADGLSYAADNGAKVVNASLGGPASVAITNAITNHPNTLFVASAGNSGQDNDTTPSFPCSSTAANVICVSATGNTDSLASFSNYGATSVDLAAPGVDIESTKPHYTDSFSDDFETSLGQWTLQSGPWGLVVQLGSVWLTDSPDANYADNADWAIRTSSKVDVGARSDCVMRFKYGTFLQQGFDWFYIESSTDGTTWTSLAQIGDTNGSVRSGFIALGAAGSRYYRFRLTSDASIKKGGVYIDSVRVACPGGTYNSGDYQFLNGTSMASPQVAGAAAVLFAAKPSATVAAVKDALLNGGDPLAGLTGKTVSGRRLNLNGALAALGKTDTTATISSDDPDPSGLGQVVTVDYAVTPNAPGPGAPTGNVTVTDGTDSCTGTVAAGQCTITFATAGSKPLTATYAGDLNYKASPPSATVSHEVNRAVTTTTITSDTPDPSVLGQAVTVSFAVAPESGTPTGNVTVSDGVDSCTGTVAAGQCSIALTTVSSRTLTARYDGDNNFRPSSSRAEAHTVNPAVSSGGEQVTVNPANRLAPPLAHVFGASQSHAKFRVAPKRQLVQVSRRRAPIGTVFSYSLDIPAAVRFDFTQPGSGRTVSGRCVASTKRNKHKPKCTLERGSLAFAGHAGLNTVHFSGWLAGAKKLAHGSYTLVITAITPGVGATAQTLRFSVVR